jgi:hypothetical protein
MRVTFEHRTKVVGMMRKVTQYDVALTVDFSEEEKAIIAQFSLAETCILERQLDSIRIKKYSEQDLIALAQDFNLTVRGLLRDRTDIFTFDRYIDARNYQFEATDGLKKLKAFLQLHAEPLPSPTSFEL